MILRSIVIILLLLCGCTNNATAPVTHRITDKSKPAASQKNAGFHIVKSGDTLHYIAWHYHLDYRNVALWNQIEAPYTIYPGQLIRLKPDILAKKNRSFDQDNKTTEPKKPTQKKTASTANTNTTARSIPSDKLNLKSVTWSWPAQGQLVKLTSTVSKKGINISGQDRQLIKAAASGRVVYSGSGLVGYGKLIIIKHNDKYLSAYAHNSALLVKEGDDVQVGQNIARMGQNYTGQNVLYFEIRRNGKPVNPVQYLPKKSALNQAN